MLIMLGFFTAGLIALLLAPTVWRRAVRLTTRRIEATMPMSLADIEADKDMLRATYAIQIRRLETALEKAREKSAGQLVEISKLHINIAELQEQKAALQRLLDERTNAANVFEKTIKKRFPELDAQLNAARAALDERGVELTDLRNKVSRKEEATTLAQQASTHQQNEIRQLREALEKSGADQTGRFKKRPAQWTLEEYRSEYDRLNLELSKMREQLALAQDRESHQAVVLKAEMQQLAEQIMTVVATQAKEPPAATHREDTPRPTQAARETSRRNKNPTRTERPTVAPKPWPKAQILEEKEHSPDREIISPLNSQKTAVENIPMASPVELTQTEPAGEQELKNSAGDMRQNNKFTESFSETMRHSSLSQSVTGTNTTDSVAPSRVFTRSSMNASAVDHSADEHGADDDRAALKSLLDRGAKTSLKADAEAGTALSAMFGAKETAAEARVANAFIPGPDAIPAGVTLASLAQPMAVEDVPAAAPEPVGQEAPMDRMLREIFENRSSAASAERAAAKIDGATGDASTKKAELMQRLRVMQERQTG